ncbi:MAG: hypothetical protein JKY60_13735 [Kordiimonadaceae bacterium]|nr:hypothetical protein [Kordiimonadaceae bacterium]
MPISGLSSPFATAASAITGDAARDGASLAADFDDFLTLLTTQLQNQDPLDPLDSSEFTQQLVAFSGVEQQIQANQNLETLADLTRLSNVGSSAAYLGNEAFIESPTGDHVNDGITWLYFNETSAQALTLKVVDESGATVYQQSGSELLGTQTFEWDGLTAGGTVADAGNYTLVIDATDTGGDRLSPRIGVQETITAIDSSGFEPIFTIGPNQVAQSDILRLLLGR